MSAKVYIILGTPGSDRREIIYDLIEGSSESNAKTDVYIHENEIGFPKRAEFAALKNTTIFSWDDNLPTNDSEYADEDRIFIITNGIESPIDQLEMIKKWLKRNDLALTRIISIINCSLLHKEEDLAPYYEALVHFSDYVLLNKRAGVPERFIKDLLDKFEKQKLPCRFELVKNNRVSNPYDVLENEARRISHFFDPFEVEDLEIDENNLPEGPFDIKPQDDKYMARHEKGERIINLPSVKDFIK